MERKQILVIEDEEYILDNIKILLESENYETITANNGKEGIQKAKLLFPDLIICDIGMYGMDGYEVLNELSKDEKTDLIPFIFLTAKVERSDLRKGMELGADDYIFKPFSSAELLKAIETRLNKYQTVVAKISSRQDAGKDSSLNKKLELSDNIFVSFHKTVVPVRLQKILYIAAVNQYSRIVLENQRNFVIRKSLSDWEKMLPEKHFIRIHRSTIINLGHINKIEKFPDSTYKVSLKNIPDIFEISRRYAKKIKKVI